MSENEDESENESENENKNENESGMKVKINIKVKMNMSLGTHSPVAMPLPSPSPLPSSSSSVGRDASDGDGDTMASPSSRRAAVDSSCLSFDVPTAFPPPATDRGRRRIAPPPSRAHTLPSPPTAPPHLTLPEQNLVHVIVQSVLPVTRTSMTPNLDARGVDDVGEATC